MFEHAAGRGGRLALVAAAGLLLVTGCGASDDPVAARARDFYGAIGAGDGARACADLAAEARSSLEEQEGKPCEDAVLDEGLSEVSGRPAVKVYGSMAQVSFPSETAFLSRFDGGWRLTAVGCHPVRPGDPYDCAIEVG
jgi:hypothetical protein